MKGFFWNWSTQAAVCDRSPSSTQRPLRRRFPLPTPPLRPRPRRPPRRTPTRGLAHTLPWGFGGGGVRTSPYPHPPCKNLTRRLAPGSFPWDALCVEGGVMLVQIRITHPFHTDPQLLLKVGVRGWVLLSSPGQGESTPDSLGSPLGPKRGKKVPPSARFSSLQNF